MSFPEDKVHFRTNYSDQLNDKKDKVCWLLQFIFAFMSLDKCAAATLSKPVTISHLSDTNL
jgi:hypothetical protein